MGLAMGQARSGAPRAGDQQRHYRTQAERRVAGPAKRATARAGGAAAMGARRGSQAGRPRLARSDRADSDRHQIGYDVDDASSAGVGSRDRKSTRLNSS